MSALAVLLVVVCASIVLGVCVLFVFHPDYDTGLVGAIGLGMVAIAALIRVTGALQSPGMVAVGPIGIFVWIGLALALGRMAWKFLRRAKRRDRSWYDDGRRKLKQGGY